MGNRAEAIKFFNQGVAHTKDDPNLAYRLFMSAAYVDQTFAEAWYAIGNANSDMKLIEASVAAHRRAVEADPNHAKSWSNLGHQLYHMGDHKGARWATEKAIELDPTQSMPWCNLSLIQSVAGELRASIKSAEEGYRLEQSPTTEMALAFAYLFAGDWARGLQHFEARFAYRFKDFEKYPYERWTGQPLTSEPTEQNPSGRKTLLLTAEQGIGDTLSFARFIPRVIAQGGNLILHVQSSLVKLFQAMFEQDETDKQGAVIVMPTPQPFPPADYWTTPTSLPFALGLTNDEIEREQFPQIPAFMSPPTWKLPDRRFHIGVCWAGSPHNDIDRWRSFDARFFLMLAKIPGVALYSLQVGDKARDIHDCGAAALVQDLQHHIRDVSDTIAILKNLDMVITCESFLGHLAGSLGMECWTLVAKNGGDYRHRRSGDTPLWYPTTKIFRQGDDAMWKPVFEKVVRELGRKVGKIHE